MPLPPPRELCNSIHPIVGGIEVLGMPGIEPGFSDFRSHGVEHC